MLSSRDLNGSGSEFRISVTCCLVAKVPSRFMEMVEAGNLDLVARARRAMYRADTSEEAYSVNLGTFSYDFRDVAGASIVTVAGAVTDPLIHVRSHLLSPFLFMGLIRKPIFTLGRRDGFGVRRRRSAQLSVTVARRRPGRQELSPQPQTSL